MFEINSYLKYQDKFFNINDEKAVLDLRGKIDFDYLEGAITISYWSDEIIGLEYWDYVDQLWKYIINMICEYINNGFAEFFFPDQPIKVRIEKKNDKMCFFAIGPDSNMKVFYIPFRDLFESIIDSYKNFCEIMQKCLCVEIYANKKELDIILNFLL